MASVPSTKVTPVMFQLFSLPGIFLTTFEGITPALLSNSDVHPMSIPPEELKQLALYTYVYSDGPTAVATSGTDCQLEGIAVPLAVELIDRALAGLRGIETGRAVGRGHHRSPADLREPSGTVVEVLHAVAPGSFVQERSPKTLYV